MANGGGLVLQKSWQVRRGVKNTSAESTNMGTFSVTRIIGCHVGYFYTQGGWFLMGGNQPSSILSSCIHHVGILSILLSIWQPVLVKMPAGRGLVPTEIRGLKSNQIYCVLALCVQWARARHTQRTRDTSLCPRGAQGSFCSFKICFY